MNDAGGDCNGCRFNVNDAGDCNGCRSDCGRAGDGAGAGVSDVIDGTNVIEDSAVMMGSAVGSSKAKHIAVSSLRKYCL